MYSALKGHRQAVLRGGCFAMIDRPFYPSPRSPKDFSAAIDFTLAELHRRKGKRGTIPPARDVGLGPLYFNRALVHVCLGDDASALDDLDRAVAKESRNIS